MMVSDFIDQDRGFLPLTGDIATAPNPDTLKSARVLFEYGAGKQGCQRCRSYILQNRFTQWLTTLLCGYLTNHTLVWLFDQSSCHRAFADDAINAHRMNV